MSSDLVKNSPSTPDMLLFDCIETVGSKFGHPYTKESLVKQVENLSDLQKEGATTSLLKFSEVLKKAEIERIPLDDDCGLLNLWLKEMGFYLSFDPKDYLSKGDIVEIYDRDFVQIYRNNTFYKFCSYDPLTLATTPFPQLFKRDDHINEIIFKRAQECLKNLKSIRTIDTPLHTMQEHFARNSRVYEIEHKYCSPVFKSSSNESIAFICTQKASYIGESNIIGMGKIFDH